VPVGTFCIKLLAFNHACAFATGASSAAWPSDERALRAAQWLQTGAASAGPLPSVILALLAFAAGVALLQTRALLPDPSWGPLLLSVLVLLVGLRERSYVQARAALLLVAATLFGFGYAAWRAELRLADALPPEWDGAEVALVGVVDDLPRVSERGYRFALRVEEVLTPGAQVPQRISLSWHARAIDGATTVDVPMLHAGERWRLDVRLRRPHGNVNPGGFDLEAWLLERNLRATGYVRPNGGNARLTAFAGAPRDYVQRARERIRSHALDVLGAAPYSGVLVALAIGDQSGIDDHAWTVFNRTGIGHLVSVSGLHVTVFALFAGGLAFAIVRRMTFMTSHIPARKIAAAAGLAASCGYVLLAGAEVPAQRTLAMLAVSSLGLWLGRPGTGALVWSWALGAVLAWDPWAVLSPGFWLSFFAVGLLIYVGSGRLIASRPPRWTARVAANVAQAARGQWAITLGLVPLSLALFQQVSLIGPLANAAAIPLVTFVVVPITLFAALLGVPLAWLVAHAALAPLMTAMASLAALDGAAWAQHKPPDGAVLAGIAGVLVCLAPRGLPGRFLGLVALVPMFAWRPLPPAPSTFRMTVLDVGQGTAIVVRTHSHALLYDTGPGWHETADAGSRIVAPFLRAEGVRRLDVMIVSHKDLDHSGGALSVLQVVPVGVLVSSLPLDSPIVARQSERGAALRCRDGQRWSWDGVAFEIVFPDDAHYGDALRRSNDLSCVLRITTPAGHALLAGDIEAVSEIELVTTRRDALAADVLVVPHHGSRTSSTSSFVEAVAPRHAVFTVGHRNRYGHPRADVVGRYVRANAQIHRTDHSGALTFTFDAPGPGPPHAERAATRRYWHAAAADP
jgi:competence protein ComEC